ncbi:MAG: hypothetical protein IJ297_04495 [Clostridia bacterium]|nr:hypothetical protein [Clostridia bacterium]
MKKVLCLILTLIMLMPSVIVLAEEESIPTSGECLGGLFWEFDNGVLTISGEGEMGTTIA